MSDFVSGGYTNSPPSNTFIEKRVLDKQVQIDWLSVSFDFINVKKIYSNYYEVDLDSKFQKLVSLLGYTGALGSIPRISAPGAFNHGFQIGEHVKIFYGSEKVKNRFGNYTMNLVLSGQACYEFEHYLGGNFKDLFKYLLSFDHTNITRLDIALDVFKNNVISIYDIEDFLRKRNFTSPFRNVDFHISLRTAPTEMLSSGYTIYVGSDHAYQLCMYDKKLERRNAGVVVDTDVWERYEMRIKDDKAMDFANQYILAIESNESKGFMRLVNELLLYMLNLKNKGSSTDKNRSRWKTDERWLEFLEDNKLIDLKNKKKIDTTIESRKEWSQHSLSKVFSGFFTSFESDDETFNVYLYKLVLDGLKKLMLKNWLK